MDRTDKKLRGANATDSSHTALLLIDFINDFSFKAAEELLPHARAAAEATAHLKARARRAGVPCVYVNDNFGRWRSQFDQVLEHCMRRGMRGREIAQRLAPSAQDYFVLKPKHSGFYMTPLALLLESLGAQRLILTGLLADSCVTFTANDAYLRGYRLCVPGDCVASMQPGHVEQALAYMQRTLKAEVCTAQSLRLDTRKP